MSRPRYIDLPFRQARRAKWAAGRETHGSGKFVGEPLEELYEELLDACNYVREAERQGRRLDGMARVLKTLGRQVQQAYRRGRGEGANP